MRAQIEERHRAAQAAIANPIARQLAVGVGTGLSPYAAGTVASLAATLVLWPLLPHLEWTAGILALLATLSSIAIARRMPKSADPSWFVLDEFAGQWLTLALIGPSSALEALFCFAAFRLFDISKPFPIRWSEKVGWGIGIVLDDLLAGAYAFVLLRLAQQLPL